MCSPVALAIGSGVIGAAGSIMQGNAQSAAYKAQAGVAEQNAKIAQLQGEEALRRGAREEAMFRQDARQFQASQTSALAASGAQLSGSALNVMADTAAGIENDTDRMRHGTLSTKWGYDVERVNHLNEASAARAAGKNAKTAGYIGAFSTLLGTAATVAGMQPVGGSTGSTVQNGKITVGADAAKRGAYAAGYFGRAAKPGPLKYGWTDQTFRGR